MGMPGFGAEASLGGRTVAGRGGRTRRAGAEGRVVPALDCEHKCLIKHLDCVLGHEKNCMDRLRMCRFWCHVGGIS